MTDSNRPVGVLVTGEPVPEAHRVGGRFDTMVRRAAADHWSGSFSTIEAPLDELPPPATLAGVIVTGSPASVTDASPWMRRAGEWLREAVLGGTPVLGICFGHQLLAQALGGRVEANPRGREIGSVRATLLGPDPLFEASAQPFLVNMTHVDSVVEVPAGARVLVQTELEPNAAIRFASRTWGVQFHPEFDGAILSAYLSSRQAELEAEGIDVRATLRSVRDAPVCRAVLHRFLDLLEREARASEARPSDSG